MGGLYSFKEPPSFDHKKGSLNRSCLVGFVFHIDYFQYGVYTVVILNKFNEW
jgi:hypothetical protein